MSASIWSGTASNGICSISFEETGYADYRLISETGFSEAELEKIGQIAGVQEAARYLTVTADVAEREGDSVALAVTTNPAVSGVLVTDGEDYDPQSADGIWLSDHYAAENDLSVGDTLTLTYKSLSLTGRIRGLIKAGEFMVNVRDSSQLMPDYKTYGFAYIAPVFYEKASGADFYPQIHVISGLDKQDFFDAADRALGYTPCWRSRRTRPALIPRPRVNRTRARRWGRSFRCCFF